MNAASAIDNLKLGFRVATTNWPLILIAIAESIAAIVFVALAVLLAAFPIVIGFFRGEDVIPEEPAALGQWVLEHPFMVLGTLVAVLVAAVAAIALHSFVQAGRIAIYEKSRQLGGASVFTPELWIEEGREGWFRLFLIYHAIYGIYSLIFLIPIATIAGVVLTKGSPAAVVIGCSGMSIFFLLAIVLGVAVFLWSTMATTDAVLQRSGPGEAMANGWSDVKRSFAPLLGVSVVVLVLSIALSGIFSVFSLLLELMSMNDSIRLVLVPFQIGISVVQSAISVVFSCWLLAAMIPYAGRSRREQNAAAAPIASQPLFR
jgi:hypothetical protein